MPSRRIREKIGTRRQDAPSGSDASRPRSKERTRAMVDRDPFILNRLTEFRQAELLRAVRAGRVGPTTALRRATGRLLVTIGVALSGGDDGAGAPSLRPAGVTR
jgi:hypothetical protein